MKAMILAAGRGERMRPLTDHTPKPLLKVGEKALIEYHLNALAKAGCTEVVINVAHLPQAFYKTLGNGKPYGLTIHYSEETQGALETGGGIVKAMPWLKPGPFLVVNGDIWTDYPFENLLSKIPPYPPLIKGGSFNTPPLIKGGSFNTPPLTKGGGGDLLAHVVLVPNPAHHSEGDYALQNGFLSLQGTHFTYSGIGIYRCEFFKDCKEKVFSLSELLTQAARGIPRVSGEIYHGIWHDIGTPSRLQSLEKTKYIPHDDNLMEMKHVFNQVEKALLRLEEILNKPMEKDRSNIDASIQRFKFTIELFWKLLKKIMESRGKETLFPKDVLREAYAGHLINNETLWLQMLIDRNRSSHTYDEGLANQIYKNIKTYYPELRSTFETLKQNYHKS